MESTSNSSYSRSMLVIKVYKCDKLIGEFPYNLKGVKDAETFCENDSCNLMVDDERIEINNDPFTQRYYVRFMRTHTLSSFPYEK